MGPRILHFSSTTSRTFLSILVLICTINAGAQPSTVHELYVKPTEGSSCPAEPCHTLDEYVQDVTQYFISNTKFLFLPGDHSLSQPLSVLGVTNLALVSINGTVNITCQHDSLSITFTEISNLTLNGLTLTMCGTVGLTDLINLNVSRVSVSVWFSWQVPALNATNIIGHSYLIGLRIVMPNVLTLMERDIVSIIYSNYSRLRPPDRNQLVIKDTSIMSSEPNSCSLTIRLCQSTYAVVLHIETVMLSMIGGLYFVITSTVANNLTFERLHLNSTQLAITDTASNASSVHIDHSQLSSFVAFVATSASVTLENTLIDHSCGSCIDVGLTIKSHRSNPFVLKNVTFSGMKIRNYNPDITRYTYDGVYVGGSSNVSFIDCKFINNDEIGSTISLRGSLVVLVNSVYVNFTDCEFRDNIGTPITAVDSTFVLSGSNSFRSNRAYKGGALAFYGHSYVLLSSGSKSLFENNSAEAVGGVIYNDYDVMNSQCFFTFSFTSPRCDPTPAVNLSFSDNNALSGGDIIYGASFDTCSLSTDLGIQCPGWSFITSVFRINQRNGSNVSAITSDPIRACLCENGRPVCTRVFNSLETYPGEPFQISAAVVGDRFGTVDGSVYAQVLLLTETRDVVELGSLEYSQRIKNVSCTTLSYTILSNSTDVTLVLAANTLPINKYPSSTLIMEVEKEIFSFTRFGMIGSNLRSFPVYVNITILSCPLGFMLSGKPPRCTCDIQLVNHHIFCNLTAQTIQRGGNEWVNASFHNNTSNGVIVSRYCPHNYCKLQAVDVHLEHPDTQCAFDHSGILCGGCRSELSLALGSHQCLSCTNKYLALLVPFALAGFALVFFIKVLNLTVAKGTLNGLIFYANIVRANQALWVPAHKTNILTVFIAWINLDLGIETCFFDGLDAYGKTWLQFLFPLYVWAIVIVIIVHSHYFSTGVKLFGSNLVPVLATLFLLSYAKLLRTIISIFQASTLNFPDGKAETLWSYDGNVHYFSGKRIPLIIAAVAVTLFLWLPYTGILLFAQFLQRISNYNVTRVLLKLKPFFDAYFGSFKDSHRYWVGLMLLVRGILFISFSITPADRSEVDLLIVLVVVVCLLVYLGYVGQIYKKSYLSLLELSFFLNLSILAGGTLYVNTTPGGSVSSLAFVSMGIAFVQFLVICIFHAASSLKETRIGQRVMLAISPGMQNTPNRAEYEEVFDEPLNMNVAEQELVIDYREPLLKCLDRKN